MIEIGAILITAIHSREKRVLTPGFMANCPTLEEIRAAQERDLAAAEAPTVVPVRVLLVGQVNPVHQRRGQSPSLNPLLALPSADRAWPRTPA
jgi:hypothetical protein